MGKETEQTTGKGDQVIPFLKWAGGKRWLVSSHCEIFPTKYNRYIEPFLGSGAVFFHLRPSRALLSDANTDLISTYRVIRDDWQALGKILRRHQRCHCDNYFYSVRAAQPADRVEKAARFLYLNRTCWNGLYRVNRQGQFNVPRGTKDAVTLESDDFEKVSRLLRRASIRNSDFEKVIDLAGDGDFLFVDPPYTVKHNLNGFVKYNNKIFSWDDQIRLRDAVSRAGARGAKLLMTNAHHESVIDLYRGFDMFPLGRHSVLAGSAAGRGRTEELIISNFQAPNATLRRMEAPPLLLNANGRSLR